MRQRSLERVRVWQDMLDAWKRSGQTVNAFCRARKLTRSNFDRWRRILASGSIKSKAPSPRFVPLRIVADSMAEVVLRSGVVIRLPLTSASDAVTRLVAAVGAASC
jgi:hypothetical protein